jgi:hypothetical protein
VASARREARERPLAYLLAAVVMALAACAPSPPQGPATYDLPPRPVRTDEIPLHVPPTMSGDTQFELMGLTSGMPTVIGSHADWPAKGQFVRLRVAVTNTGRTTALFDSRHQLLVASDGSARHPDEDAMLIKRQPAEVDLGSTVRLEFDLWFDIPKDAHATVLRAFGGGTLADLSDGHSVDIPISTGA